MWELKLSKQVKAADIGIGKTCWIRELETNQSYTVGFLGSALSRDWGDALLLDLSKSILGIISIALSKVQHWKFIQYIEKGLTIYCVLLVFYIAVIGQRVNRDQEPKKGRGMTELGSTELLKFHTFCFLIRVQRK